MLRFSALIPLLALLAANAPAPAPAPPPDTPRLPSDDLFLNPRRSVHRFDDFVYTAKDRGLEIAEKVKRVRKQLSDRKLDGVLIGTEANFGWITGGGKDTVVLTQRESPVKLLVTTDKIY